MSFSGNHMVDMDDDSMEHPLLKAEVQCTCCLCGEFNPVEGVKWINSMNAPVCVQCITSPHGVLFVAALKVAPHKYKELNNELLDKGAVIPSAFQFNIYHQPFWDNVNHSLLLKIRDVKQSIRIKQATKNIS